MRTVNDSLCSGQSMGSSYNGSAQSVEQIYGFSVQAVYTGTPTGTLKLQASNDAPPAGSSSGSWAPTNWTDIPTQSVSLTGSAGSTLFEVANSNYRFIRLVYVQSASTGSLSARFNGKGV